MASQPKDAVLQVRLPSDLAERYRELCDEEMTPASVRIRRFILGEVRDWEARNARQAVQKPPEAREAVKSAPPPVSASAALSAARQTVDQGMSRKERREAERKRRKGLTDDDE